MDLQQLLAIERDATPEFEFIERLPVLLQNLSAMLQRLRHCLLERWRVNIH
jgi:hypothetical protein